MDTKKLAQIFLAAKTPVEMEALLKDLLTPAEIQDLLERWKIIDLLLQGETQRSVRDRVGVSIAKVSRGAAVIQTGTGAFQDIWKKIEKKSR